MRCSSILVAGLWTASACAGGPVTSTFDTDAEGWRITDLACSDFANVLSVSGVNWVESDGDPDGHVGQVDPSSNCFFFDAPASFLGDRSAFVGATLRFSLRTTVNDWQPGSVLALIGGGGTVLVRDFAQPDTSWRRYVVPLEADAFRVQNEPGFMSLRSATTSSRTSGVSCSSSRG